MRLGREMRRDVGLDSVPQVLLRCIVFDLVHVVVDAVTGRANVNVGFESIQRLSSPGESLLPLHGVRTCSSLILCHGEVAQPEDIRSNSDLERRKHRATIRLCRPTAFHDIPHGVREADVGRRGRLERPFTRQHL
jgi:hypothetical protein